jgi:hypothetical protein
VEVTEGTIIRACVVYTYIGKTQATEVKRKEEDILKQEQQNANVSVGQAACFGGPSTEAMQVRRSKKTSLYQFLGDKNA